MVQDDQITIKIKKDTKQNLDSIKHSPSESYNDVITNLLETASNSISSDIQNQDADWKVVKREEQFFKCPKCQHLWMSFAIFKLLHMVNDYLIYGGVWELSRIKSVLINSQNSEFKTEKDVLNFIKRLKEKNKDLLTFSVLPSKESKELDYLGLQDMEISTCHNCNETFPVDEWKEGTKTVDVFTCPRCQMHVTDDEENRSLKDGILMCPKCLYYFDRTWEIFNHIKQEHPTIDHLRYDKKNGMIKIHPYECSTDYLIKLLLIAKKMKYSVQISGRGEHNPNCLTIKLQRNMKS